MDKFGSSFCRFFSASHIRFSTGLMKSHCLQNLPSRYFHKLNVCVLGSNSSSLVSASFYASVNELEEQESKLILEVIPFTEIDL